MFNLYSAINTAGHSLKLPHSSIAVTHVAHRVLTHIRETSIEGEGQYAEQETLKCGIRQASLDWPREFPDDYAHRSTNDHFLF